MKRGADLKVRTTPGGAAMKRGADLKVRTTLGGAAMKRAWMLVVLVIAAADTSRTAPGDALVSLSEFFKPGVVFQDLNGDGVIDFVNAHVVLPGHPTPGEVTAGANVAARLGFETTAMDLPVVRAAG